MIFGILSGTPIIPSLVILTENDAGHGQNEEGVNVRLDYFHVGLKLRYVHRVTHVCLLGSVTRNVSHVNKIWKSFGRCKN